MDRNVKIAKELIKLAKNLVATDDMIIKKIFGWLFRNKAEEIFDYTPPKRINKTKFALTMTTLSSTIEKQMHSSIKDYIEKNNLFDGATVTNYLNYSNDYDSLDEEFGQDIMGRIASNLKKEGIISED